MTGMNGDPYASYYGKEKIPKGHGKYKINQYTPEQTELFRNSFSHLGPDSYLSKLAGGDEETYNQMEAPALRQFNELQGNIASRFSGQGLGGRRGSGFQNTSTAATSNFAQDLQSKRSELRRQAIKDLLGMSGDLLNQRPFETGLTEKAKPWWQELLMSAGKGFGEGAGKAGAESLFGGGSAIGAPGG